MSHFTAATVSATSAANTSYVPLSTIANDNNNDTTTTTNNNNNNNNINTTSASSLSAYNNVSMTILTSGISVEDEELLAKFMTTFTNTTLTHTFRSPVIANTAANTTATNNNNNNNSNPPPPVTTTYLTTPATTTTIAATTTTTATAASVTHLIVPVDENNVFQQRTMKYMQAIICKFLSIHSFPLSLNIRRGICLFYFMLLIT
jgi:hypothetical protein